MKKLLLIITIAMQSILFSCGPTAEQKAAAAKLVEDSVAAAQAQMEAAKEAARQQAIDDSIYNASLVDTLQ